MLFDWPLTYFQVPCISHPWDYITIEVIRADDLQSCAMYMSHTNQHQPQNTTDVRNHDHRLALSYQLLVMYNVQTFGLFGSAKKGNDYFLYILLTFKNGQALYPKMS